MIAPTPPSLLLLDLPDEILISILGYLDIPSLRNAVLVCKHFNGLAEPFLYHTIEILNGLQAAALSASLYANPHRTTWIRSLLVSTKFGEDEGLNTLPPHMAEMRNLQELCLETPDCNAKFPDERVGWVNLQDRYERIFESASAVVPQSARVLPNLRKCRPFHQLTLLMAGLTYPRYITFRGWPEGDVLYDQIPHALSAPQPPVPDHLLCQHRLP